MKKQLLFIAALFSFGIFNAQISVSHIGTTGALINYLQGYGLTISNMQITGDTNQLGFFSGVSNMAFGSGVIMSTGYVDSVPGPASKFACGVMNGNGDADLTLAAGMSTYDASVVEFDCIPLNDTILFDFAFGSEEYPEYVNTGFNDVFAIYVSGPDPSGGNYVNKNLALIPNTSTVVSINSINATTNSS